MRAEKLDPLRCIAQVKQGGRGAFGHFGQCSRRRVCGDYCRQHSPQAERERVDAANAKAREKLARADRRETLYQRALAFDFIGFFEEQKAFSAATFGPGQRLSGVTAHIEKELAELRACGGSDVSEWADVIILAIDGAWRSGHRAEALAAAIKAKLEKNKRRPWPDWRTAGDGPIEHVRGTHD